MKFRLRQYFLSGKKKPTKPLKTTARDEMRPILREAWLDVVDGTPVIITTDAYVMTRVPLDKLDAGEIEPGMIPREALERAQRYPKEEIEVGENDVQVGDRASYKRPDPEGKYPDWRAILETESSERPEEPLVFGFSTTLLANIAAALGTDQLEVQIDLAQIDRPEGGQPTYRKALVLRPTNCRPDDDRLGLQMPIALQR